MRGAGVVVGSLIAPETIANDHIRIHALEGKLFRGVVQDAATRSRLSCSIWRDRELRGLAVARLNQPEQALRDSLTALGRDIVGPWRAEQKAAALAAWLVLAGRAPAARMNRGRKPAPIRPSSRRAAHEGEAHEGIARAPRG